MINVDAVFVAHLKKGSEERAAQMNKQLNALGIDFEYMLDGDIEDLTPERKVKYFGLDNPMHISGMSCTMKHILIYEEMVKRSLQRVLILEDDAVLRKNFVELFNRSMKEMDNHPMDQPFLAYYEASGLIFIPRSKRRRGTVLYKAERMQCTACYVVNLAFAKTCLQYTVEHLATHPIDNHIEQMRVENVVPVMYQSHPELCIQGSHIGMTNSLIADRTWWNFLRRRLSFAYKKYILYNLR